MILRTVAVAIAVIVSCFIAGHLIDALAHATL
jgi:hypothetical protein